MTPNGSTATVSRARLPEAGFGPFVFDPNRRLLKRAGTEVPLPPRVLGVLEILLSRPGDVVSRQELIDSVWKDAFVTDTSLAEAVSFLRQALGDDPQSPTYIQTVHRRGYRFVAPLNDEPLAHLASTAQAAAARDAIRPSIANELVPWSVAILATALGVSALWYATRREPVTLPVVSVAFDPGPGLRFDTRAPALAVSRSGSKVAWSACDGSACQLYLRPLEQLSGRPLLDTADAAAPFFSPDERWLGFFADGKLKKVALSGGAAQIIADASQPFGGAWMPDGRIIFAASVAGGLRRVREEGGDAEVMTVPAASRGEIRHAFPALTRDDDALLFTVVTSPLAGAPGLLALLPNRSTGASWRVLVEGAEIGVPIGHEYVAFARGSEVHAVAFDRVRQATASLEQTVVTGIVAPHIAASAAGAFTVLTAAPPAAAGPPAPLAWAPPSTRPLADGIEDLLEPRLSPDGRMLAAVGVEPRPDVWLLDLERGTKTRVTFLGPTASPVWSPSGGALLYATRRAAGYEIWSKEISGSSSDRRVLATPDRHLFPASVSRAGDLAFVESGGPSLSNIGILRAGHTAGSLVVESPFDDVAPALSPEGTSLAFQTDESGRWEIVLLRLDDSRRLPVSSGGGTRPFWSADGRALFFQRGDELLRTAISPEGAVGGTPSVVLSLNGASPAGIAPDGSILLRRKRAPIPASAVLTLQWINELRAKLGPLTPTSPR